MDKVRVVRAVVCNKCDSINGKENVIEMEQKDVERRLKNEPDTFFASEDPFRKASYRLIIPIGSCVQC